MIPMRPDPMPEGSTLVHFGQSQGEYHTLPGAVCDLELSSGQIISRGMVVTEWEPSAEELDRLFKGGRVRISVLTFGRELQPLLVEASE